MHAIIVTHPSKGWKACLHGIPLNQLKKLAELRYVKETIKKRFKIIEYKDEKSLAIKMDKLVVGMYKITPETYKKEVFEYYEIT